VHNGEIADEEQPRAQVQTPTRGVVKKISNWKKSEEKSERKRNINI
jgi:hypothetical protein